jgi:hypothetical protein
MPAMRGGPTGLRDFLHTGDLDRRDAEVGVVDMRVIAREHGSPITRMDPALCVVIFWL